MPVLLVYAFGGAWGADLDTGSEGGLFAWVSISATSFGATLFGLAGLITVWVGLSPVAGILVAALVAASAVVFHNSLFGWLRSTEASSELTKGDLKGATGVVVLGVSARRRGQIVVEAAGRRLRMSASLADRQGHVARGHRARIVEMDGGVALIERYEEGNG